MPRGRHSGKSGEHSFDKISARSAQGNRHHTHRREVPGDSSEGNHTSAASPILVVGNARDLSLERRDGEDDEDGLALGDDSFEAGEDLVSDIQGIPDDDRIISSAKKQNIRSRVEQPPHQETGGHDDLRASNSDGSRAKSGSSKDYQKRRECGEEVMQDGRERPIGDLRKRHEEEQNFQRKDDYGRDGRHGDRDRVASKGREVAYHSYTHRGWDPNSAHTVRGRSEGFVRSKEMNGTAAGRQRRDDDIHSRRNKDEDTRRERHEEARSRDMNRVKASDKNNKDDGVHSRKQVDDGDWRGTRREVGPRQRDRDGMLMRRREVDDPLSKKKEEEHLRRGKDDKEDSSRRKRERDDGAADLRRRDDDIRKRDKTEDHHSVKHRDDNWRQRERDESQRHKQPREDVSSHRDRGTRNGRASEDKPLSGNIKNKDNSKALVAEKDNHHRDRKQQDEQVKRSDRTSEKNHSQNKGREDVQALEKQSHNEERSSRRQRLSSHSDRPSNASSNQQTHREKHREVTNKSKDLDASEQNAQESVKKKQGDYNTQRNEKVSLIKGSNEQESNGVSSAADSKKGRHRNNEQVDEVEASHSPGKLGEEDQGSDEESQKGRSKLERWTSQKERDYSAIKGGAECAHSEMVHGDESIIRTEAIGGADDSETSAADAAAKVVMDGTGEDQDVHLDTIAKLKRRSERFKLPMPGEETSSNKAESETQTAGQDEVFVDVEIMPERPARKRRWTGI